MSTTTIGGMTAGTAGNLTGAALLEMEDSASASVRFSAATLRTQMFAGGTGFTSTDPLLCGTVTANQVITCNRTSAASTLGYFAVTRNGTALYYLGQDGSDNGVILNAAATTPNITWTDAGVFTFRSTVITVASATGAAGLRLPHGAAPTSPTNGDMWTTTAGAFIRINGVTKTFTLT